eukprot:UN25759
MELFSCINYDLTGQCIVQRDVQNLQKNSILRRIELLGHTENKFKIDLQGKKMDLITKFNKEYEHSSKEESHVLVFKDKEGKVLNRKKIGVIYNNYFTTDVLEEFHNLLDNTSKLFYLIKNHKSITGLDNKSISEWDKCLCMSVVKTQERSAIR